uniref:Izumo sperm-egg fusion protein 1 n=1 Tax=Geotrypetes seraphini TaxID=260995 RepID=A0A6P8SUL3_GEOSA|nr:izumo sperm-egg fusion protein 1 [Geotrypetes seraphini]
MWGTFLLLLVLAGRALSCLRCDTETEELLQDMKQDYISHHVTGGRWNLKEKMRHFLDASVDTFFTTMPLTTGRFIGIIDDITLFKTSSRLKHVLRRLMNENLKDEELFNEMVWSIQQMKPDLQELMAEFSKERTLVQTFITCADCKKSRHVCTKSLSCGERSLSVVEDEDLILDCALVWHLKMELFKDYAFYKVVSGKKVMLSVGTDAILVIKGVALQDAGQYQCDANDSSGNPFSTIMYIVKVDKAQTDLRIIHVRPTLEPVRQVTPHLPEDVAAEAETSRTAMWVVLGGSCAIILIVSLSA